jgi:8-oxo-dGTP diphosphatase
MGEVLPGLRAVARVLVMNQQGELLLCRSRDGKAWVPPGGTMDAGETLASAAAREAEEEAGLVVTLGPLLYVQDFRPARRAEHVIEVGFLATAAESSPEHGPAADRVAPAGPDGQPWAAWLIADVDGPRREVRWFAREALAALAEPVFPVYLRKRFWEEGLRPDRANPYLGLVEGK